MSDDLFADREFDLALCSHLLFLYSEQLTADFHLASIRELCRVAGEVRVFPAGITVIVGPNGSGKSNIVDAIKWVLGEKQAKNIRGERMEDIIFTGTEGRKPLSLAEVSITIDNTNRLLTLDSDSVSVTRRVFREGARPGWRSACPRR